MNLKICGSLADKLHSRGFGRRKGKCVELSWEEMAYLVEKKIIDEDFSDVVRKASSSISNFDIRYLAYRDLRDRGYVLSVENGYFKGRKNYAMDFYPISDMDEFSVDDMRNKEFPLILAVVDFDGETTYYLVELINPEGKYHILPEEKIDLEFHGNRAFSFESIKSLEERTYGKDEGTWGHLSLLEVSYLAEKGILDNTPIMESDIYLVYRDLRNRGLIVKSGFKYGTHFRVYERSMDEHSKYLVHVISKREEIQKISRAVRVAHGVKKNLLLAYPDNGDILYFKFSWIRP